MPLSCSCLQYRQFKTSEDGVAFHALPTVLRLTLCRFVFLQRLRLPLAAKYDNPEHYGLARAFDACLTYESNPSAYKTRNLRIETPDGEVLGLWHIL